LRPGFWVGVVVALLVSAAVYLFGLVDLQGVLSLILLLTGVWTVVAAFAVVGPKDRTYYSSWGVVIAVLSLTYFIQLRYALALVLLAIVVLIILNLYFGKTPGTFAAATNPPQRAGDTPAAHAM
jgi:hypothetical protein